MEENQYYDTIDVDITDMNMHILQFCGKILTQFQDVLNSNEKDVCKLLIEGRSKHGVSKAIGLSEERVRQIFYKSIKKIFSAYEEVIQKTEKLTLENETLRHRCFILENELSNRRKENINESLSQEQSLCPNAVRLLDVPVRYLPLSARVINVLESANALTFKEIPLLTIERLNRIKQCGNKTIYDIKNYLAIFDLEFGMLYDEVVAKLAKLSDDDISSDNFGGYRAKKSSIEIIQESLTEDLLRHLTLSQFCDEMGHGKKARKKWGGQVMRILSENGIDTMEKFLAMKPSDFQALKGVGPSTIKHARIAFNHFGLVWTDEPRKTAKNSETTNLE